MKKILIILIAIIILIYGFVELAKWIFIEIYGPKYRTVESKIDENSILLCEEEYTADMAAVFLDVVFTLKKKENKTLRLGWGSFPDEQWEKNIQLHDVGDWYVLSAANQYFAKILLTNKLSAQNKDTILSPYDLCYDSLWKRSYYEIPEWSYTGFSRVDSIIEDRIYVTFNYRTGISTPFKAFTQTLEYRLDTASARLITMDVLDRFENRISESD